MAVKYLVSYLNVDVSWWVRHFTPNVEKFNPLSLPKNATEKIEYLLLPSIFFYLLFSLKSLGKFIIPISLSILLLLLNFITLSITNIGILGSIKFSLKISAPIYFFFVLIIHANRTGKNHKNLLIWGSLYFMFLSLVGLLLFDPSFNRGSMRLPIYFSGIHTHNYILSVTFIALSYFLRKNTYLLLGYFFITFSFLVFGYGIRTVIVFYFIYIAVIFYLKDGFFRNLYAKIITAIPFVFLAIIPFLQAFDFDRFSSGRLTMYKTKWEILKSYKPHEILFGRGWGSDFVKTTEWWYAEKGSHNDYLTFMIENGILYVFVFLALIFSLLLLKRKNHIIYVVLIFGYLLTSLISNGFAVRVIGSYWLFTLLAFLYVESDTKNLKFG